MTAFYNEIDPFNAEWLRRLMAADLIAPGVVDERDIRDIYPDELEGFDQHHFFAGIGVWSHALREAGWPDDKPIWTGSCPCQPHSAAGRREGANDERHLWPSWHHLIAQRRPGVIIGEQVATGNGLAWLDLVWSDLEGEDYAFGALDLSATGFGAPHIRQRLYWMADSDRGKRHRFSNGQRRLSDRQETRWAEGYGKLECGSQSGRGRMVNGFWKEAEWVQFTDRRWRPIEPRTSPLANGNPSRVALVRAYGNALVAPQAISFCKAALELAS